MTSPTVPYCMNWEWCSTFTSYCRLWCISQGSKNKQLKVLYKRIESSSTWERNPSSFEEKLQQKHSEVLYVCHRSVREISQADSNAGCSSHLHFTRKQRGSVTLWVFTDSEIEVTNRESIPSWILSGVLSGMAALINGHEQLGREKKEKKKKKNSASRATGSTLCLPAWHVTNCRDFGSAASVGSLFGYDWRCFRVRVCLFHR